MEVMTRWRDVSIAAAMTAAFVAFQLWASLRSGALNLPATYDDIGYYIDAAKRLSSGNFLLGYLADPPHAPGSTLLAILGFAIGGVKPWAADAANALPMFLFAFVLLRVLEGLPLGLRLAVAGACLTIPMFGIAIVEFRPDMWCSAFTVLGTLLIVLRDPREARHALCAGLAFSVALVMKPTFAPLIVILFGAAFVLRLAPDLRSAKEWKSATRSVLIFGGVTMALAGPHFVLSYQHLLDYYRIQVFGSNAALWTPDLSPTQTALYYVTGPGGKATLGEWTPVGFVALLAMVGRSWRILVLTLIAYAGVTIPGNKSVFLGMIFDTYIVAAIALALAYLLTVLQLRAQVLGYAVTGALLAFGLATYRLPWVQIHGAPYSPEFAATRSKLNNDLVMVLLADPAITRKTIDVPVIAQYLNGESIVFSSLQARHNLPQIAGLYIDGSLNNQLKYAARADYVVMLSVDYPDILRWTPSAKIVSDIADAIGRDEGLELVKTIALSSEPGTVRIYRRK
jgi:hypothetical protein